MSIMMIPIPEKQQQEAEYQSDGKLLAILLKTDLEKIAAVANCQPLSHFVVDDVSLDEYDPSISFEEKFYSVIEGLSSIRAIKEAIEHKPELIAYERTNFKEVLQELTLLEDWLLTLGEENRFYLAFA